MISTEEVIVRKTLWDQGYWEIPENLDTSDFDFTWRPNPYDRPYIHQFGTQWQKTGGPRFVIPNNQGVKYQSHQHAIRLPDPTNRSWRPLKHNITMDYSWHPDDTEPPFIYVFGNQWYSSEVMPTMHYKVKGATQKKYITDVTAKLLPNMERWVTPDEVDQTKFDYSWVPDPYDPPLIYQFGTQWQKTGGPTYVTSGATVVKYIDTIKSVRTSSMRGWRVLEHIDMSKFDFSWHPDETEEPYTYVFGNQWHDAKDMPTVLYRVKGSKGTKECYDQIAKVNQIEKQDYEDSIFNKVMSHGFSQRYYHFKPINTNNYVDYNSIIDGEKFYIHVLNDGEVIVPREAKEYIYDKITDYPYIKYHNLGSTLEPLDIIFLSNGETCADSNYEHLLKLTKNLPNRVIRLDGIDGRVKSQHTAAKESNTPWYFLVNGKLKVNDDFDFSWQADRLKKAQHYIFRATNPVNNLEYGHMAIVANNKKITLNTTGRGLDFTLDGAHEIVNINCGVALYNTSVWDTWRTAFRECIKLCNSKDEESKDRLNIWVTVGNGDYGSVSIQGAKDAMEYYNSVNGEMDKLMLSYDWAWLKDYFTKNVVIK